MKIKNEELIVVYEALSKLGNMQGLSCAYQVAKNKKRIEPYMNDYRKVILDIRDKNGLKDEESDSQESKDKAQLELNKYHIKQVDVDFFNIQATEHQASWDKIPANLIEPLLDYIIVE